MLKNETKRDNLTKALVKGNDDGAFVETLKAIGRWAGFNIKQEGPQYPSMGQLTPQARWRFFYYCLTLPNMDSVKSLGMWMIPLKSPLKFY
jgi:hypothetical protein